MKKATLRKMDNIWGQRLRDSFQEVLNIKTWGLFSFSVKASVLRSVYLLFRKLSIPPQTGLHVYTIDALKMMSEILLQKIIRMDLVLLNGAIRRLNGHFLSSTTPSFLEMEWTVIKM